jgi:hypothetical protein
VRVGFRGDSSDDEEIGNDDGEGEESGEEYSEEEEESEGSTPPPRAPTPYRRKARLSNQSPMPGSASDTEWSERSPRSGQTESDHASSAPLTPEAGDAVTVFAWEPVRPSGAHERDIAAERAAYRLSARLTAMLFQEALQRAGTSPVSDGNETKLMCC